MVSLWASRRVHDVSDVTSGRRDDAIRAVEASLFKDSQTGEGWFESWRRWDRGRCGTGAYIIDMPFRVLYNFRSEVSSVHIFQTTLVDGFLHPFTIDWLMNRG